MPERASIAGAAAVGDAVVVSNRGAGARAELAAAAQREVSALYEERAEEFLHYAIALGRDQELARDALQEAFMRYFVALCGGAQIAAPRAWVYRVLHNYLLDRIKETRRRKEHRLVPTLSYQSDSDLEAACVRDDFLRSLRSALTPREYDCFRLRTQGMQYEEIAAALQLRCGTVGAMLYRAMRKLRNLLHGKGGETL